MGIQFKCGKCGQPVSVPDGMIGCVVSCPNPVCGSSLTVPSAPVPPSVATVPSDDIEFRCPSCRHRLVVGNKGAGREVACPRCGKLIVVPKSAECIVPVPELQPQHATRWTPPPPPPPPSRAPINPTQGETVAPSPIPGTADVARRRKRGWVFLVLWVLLSFGLPLLALFVQRGRLLNSPPDEARIVGVEFGENGTQIPITEPVAPQSVHAGQWPFILLCVLPFVLSPLLVFSMRRLSPAVDIWFNQFRTDSMSGVAKVAMDLLIRPGPLKASSRSMIIEKKVFRETVRRVVKGVIIIVVLLAVEAIVCSLLMDSYDGRMTLKEWVKVVISLAIVAFAIRLYQSAKTVATFCLTALAKVGRIPGRETYLGNLVAAAGNLVLLIYVVSLYLCLLPWITRCNDAFMRSGSLITVCHVIVGLSVIGILFVLWKNVQPFVGRQTINEVIETDIDVVMTPGRLRASNNGMIIEKKAFTEAMRRVVKGVVAIVGLIVLKAVGLSFLRVNSYFAGMTFHSWIEVVIALIIVGLEIKRYQAVKTVVTFRLTTWVRVGRIPGRENYLGNLVAVAGNLTLLIYVVPLYMYLLPRITECNYAFMHFGSLTTMLNVSVCIAVVGVLFVLWKDAQVLIDLLTGDITDKVAPLSSDIAYVDCPACGTKNNRDAVFCLSCGGVMQQQKTPVVPVNKGAFPPKTVHGFAKHAFISHSSQNHGSAERVCAVLEGFGLSCWIAPRDIEPGASYDEEILRGIERSQAFILLLSDAANASPHVKRELMCALRAGHTVYPIRIQEVQPGPKLEYLLEGIHWVDAWKPPIEAHLDRLAQLIAGQNPAVGNTHEGASATVPNDEDRMRVQEEAKKAASDQSM